MKKILIVDDRQEIRELVEMTLRSKEYQIFKAESGEKALVIARAEIPDLILMDLEMPGGMDGLETTRALKSYPETKNCPIIILTGSTGPYYNKTEGLNAGATDYFPKPFSPLKLIKKIEALIG